MSRTHGPSSVVSWLKRKFFGRPNQPATHRLFRALQLEQLEDRTVPNTTLVFAMSGPTFAAPSDAVTYEIDLSNTGANAAANVLVGSVFPSSTTFVSDSQINGPAFSLSNTSSVSSFTISSIPAGNEAKFDITLL